MPKSLYLRFNYLSIFFIFMLFVLGGLVRATGSGMGCPDWPKCFGSYIPPTSAQDLPSNYEEIFNKQRLEKTERFVRLLNRLGMEKKAEQVMAYKELETSHSFNVAKAYTEYVNRLWGAATGIIVLLTLIFSFTLLRINFLAFLYTVLGFLAVVSNALVGAVVVYANLFGNLVTFHFIAAFAAMAFFLMARYRLRPSPVAHTENVWIKIFSVFILSVLLFQIVAGARVREIYDMLILGNNFGLHQTVELLDIQFVIHRLLALVITLMFALQFYLYYRFHGQIDMLSRYSMILIILTLVQISFGSLIITGQLEAISKLFHISIGAALFLIQFYICSLVLRRSKEA